MGISWNTRNCLWNEWHCSWGGGFFCFPHFISQIWLSCTTGCLAWLYVTNRGNGPQKFAIQYYLITWGLYSGTSHDNPLNVNSLPLVTQVPWQNNELEIRDISYVLRFACSKSKNTHPLWCFTKGTIPRRSPGAVTGRPRPCRPPAPISARDCRWHHCFTSSLVTAPAPRHGILP